MATTTEIDTDSRIARLETVTMGLREQVTGVASSVDRLASELREAKRPQWQLLLGIGAILMTTIGMAASLVLFVVTLLISPISGVQDAHAALLDRHTLRLDGATVAIERQDAALIEIETQFKALSNYGNLADSHQDRLLSLLWGRVYEEQLPGDGERPTVGR